MNNFSQHSRHTTTPASAPTNPTLIQIQEIIGGVIGIDPSAVYHDMLLEELETRNWGMIIAGINEHFELTLNPRKVLSDLDNLDEPATIDNLVAVVEEEQEWG